jgi:hypothetical protein
MWGVAFEVRHFLHAFFVFPLGMPVHIQAGHAEAMQSVLHDSVGLLKPARALSCMPAVRISVYVALFSRLVNLGALLKRRRVGIAQVAARLHLPAGGGAGEPVLAEDVYGPFSGQVTSAVRQVARRAVAEAHPRLVEAMLLCELSSTAEVLSGARAAHHLGMHDLPVSVLRVFLFRCREVL